MQDVRVGSASVDGSTVGLGQSGVAVQRPSLLTVSSKILYNVGCFVVYGLPHRLRRYHRVVPRDTRSESILHDTANCRKPESIPTMVHVSQAQRNILRRPRKFLNINLVSNRNWFMTENNFFFWPFNLLPYKSNLILDTFRWIRVRCAFWKEDKPCSFPPVGSTLCILLKIPSCLAEIFFTITTSNFNYSACYIFGTIHVSYFILNIMFIFRVYDIEKQVELPSMFRFPLFETIHWYAGVYLLQQLRRINEEQQVRFIKMKFHLLLQFWCNLHFIFL